MGSIPILGMGMFLLLIDESIKKNGERESALPLCISFMLEQYRDRLYGPFHAINPGRSAGPQAPGDRQ
ncbi:hypothetical protein [Nitratireductor pacificus]|uniref:hypothetical protein n=1 Tax=Nitratireductor pacificus TaxID=1231180 RepID=UPI001AEC6957|nr:hypothetical protein [Nitratireductor pacificus]